MDQWKNKVAVVTGASSGIGAAITVDLVKSGLVVVGLARRFERIEALKNDLPINVKANLHAMQCDLRNESEIVNTFEKIEQMFGGTDVLINNAGICQFGDITEPENTSTILNVVNTNMLAPIFCAREAVKSMKKRGKRGHIVFMNSIAGHKILPINDSSPSSNVYAPTKYAVTAMVEVMRQELVKSQTKIKVTSISPGVVKTEIVGSIDSFPDDFPALEAQDVSDAVLYVLGTPPRVQIHELIIKANGESF